MYATNLHYMSMYFHACVYMHDCMLMVCYSAWFFNKSSTLCVSISVFIWLVSVPVDWVCVSDFLLSLLAGIQFTICSCMLVCYVSLLLFTHVSSYLCLS